MKVHLFGATSSPGCASYALKHLANQERVTYPTAAHFIIHDFYVYDGLTSEESREEAKELLKDHPLTRRTVASIYDPLGFLAPLVLKAKKILQEVCQKGVSR